MANQNTKPDLEFYGGVWGAILPFIALVVGLVALVVTRHNSMKTFWIPGLVALCVSFFLAKDKKKMNDHTIGSLVDPMFSTFIIIFFLAGILSQLLRQSGMINGLLWLCTSLDVNAQFIPVITFLICVVISTACGTTGGTVTTVTPIMFPLAVTLGCDPALMLGAIISGSFFGDNLAPISDTTIASSGSMRASVPAVVRSRIKYSAIAGGTAAVLYIIFGIMTTTPVVAESATSVHNPSTLIMLVVPAIMILMMLRGAELIPVLLVCNILGVALNIMFGFITPETFINVKGPLIGGIESMLSVVIFIVFVFFQTGFIRHSGVFAVLIEKLSHLCKTARQTELATMGITIIATALVAASTVSIVIVGPIVYELFQKFQIDRHRGANFIDGTASGLAGILPWNTSLMMMFALAGSTGALPQDFSVMRLIPYSFHCQMLLVVFFFAAVTGWARKREVYEETEKGMPATDSKLKAGDTPQPADSMA